MLVYRHSCVNACQHISSQNYSYFYIDNSSCMDTDVYSDYNIRKTLSIVPDEECLVRYKLNSSDFDTHHTQYNLDLAVCH